MAQTLATVFLIMLILCVGKMVFDVQVAKLKRIFKDFLSK